MITKSAQAPCYGILLHFEKLEMCENIKTNMQKNHTLLYVVNSIRCIPEKTLKRWSGEETFEIYQRWKEGGKLSKLTFIK